MKVKSLAELNNQVKDESIALTNSGFTATLQSGTLSGNVVHTLPTVSSSLAPTASPSFTGTPTVNGVSFSGYSGFKNYIINGNFDVWQRGTSQSTLGYGSADRWFFGVLNGLVGNLSRLEIAKTNNIVWGGSYF